MIEREQVPNGGWYSEDTRDSNGVWFWTVNQRRDTDPDGDTWVAQTGIGMEETADRICRLHNAALAQGDSK